MATKIREKLVPGCYRGVFEMSRDEIRQCREHVNQALCIMERVADTQPEVHVLISLRELIEDIHWLESHGEDSANIVRLSDVKHLRAIGVSAAAE